MKVYLTALISALSFTSCIVAPPPPGTSGGVIPPPPYYYRDAPANQPGQTTPPAGAATAQNQSGPTAPPANNTPPTTPTTPAPNTAGNGADLTPLPKQDYPMGETTGNPNRVISPYKPYNVIDITGFKSGALAKDPSNGKIFRVP